MVDEVKSNDVFWEVADAVRTAGFHPYGTASILAQLCVLAELADRSDSIRNAVLEEDAGPGMYVSQLLKKSADAISELGIDPSRRLIDPDDQSWAEISENMIRDSIVKLMTLETKLPLDRAKALMDACLRAGGNKGGAGYRLPVEVLRIMADMLGERSNIFAPFDLSAVSALWVLEPHGKASIKTRTKGIYDLVSRVFFVAHLEVEIELTDPLEVSGQTPPGPTLLIPPFGGSVNRRTFANLPVALRDGKFTRLEDAALAVIAASTSDRIVAMVPSGSLFRAGMSRRVREWLVEEMGLNTVVELPPGVLEFANLSSAILLIDPNEKKEHVRIVSADSERFIESAGRGRFRLSGWEDMLHEVLGKEDSETTVSVSRTRLRNQDFVLQFNRYRESRGGLASLLRGKETKPLSAIAEIYRPRKLDEEPSGDRSVEEVMMSDFDEDGLIRRGSRTRTLVSGPDGRQLLRQDDIVLGVRGTIGKVGFVPNYGPNNLTAGATTVVLRVRSKQEVQPEYLFRYLSQPVVVEYLRSLAGGTRISFLRASDLANLPVPIVSREDQQEVVRIHVQLLQNYQEVVELRGRARALNEEAFPSELGNEETTQPNYPGDEE